MKKAFLRLFFLCLLFEVVAPAFAQQPSQASSQAAQPPANTLGSFDIHKVQSALGDSTLGGVPAPRPVGIFFIVVRIVVSLAFLTAVIVGLLWFMKKSGFTGNSRIGGGGAMDVLEVLPLGQNRSIVLVRLMDTVLVVAQTGGHTALLDRIEGPKALELMATNREGNVDMAHFKDVFNSFLDKIKTPGKQQV